MTIEDVVAAGERVFGRVLPTEEGRCEFWMDYGNGDLTVDDLTAFATLLMSCPGYDGVLVRPEEMCGIPGQTGSPRLELVVKRKAAQRDNLYD